MFDIGMTEMLLVGVVALIVVGPKDLPVLFRKAGEFVGRMKGMAREFSSAMNAAADEAGIKETADSLRKMSDPKQMGLDGINDAVDDFKSWDPESETGKLSEQRKLDKMKIQEATANAAAARQAKDVREAHAAREVAEAKKAAPKKKPAAKKAAPKASTAKKPAPKTTTAKTTAAKTPTAKKPAAKKPAAKKPAKGKA